MMTNTTTVERGARHAGRSQPLPKFPDQPPSDFDPVVMPILARHWFGLAIAFSESAEQDRAA